MKDVKIKGVIQEKISLKLNEIIKEFKIEKGRSISKVIDESAKKLAKTIAKKIKKAAKDSDSDKQVIASVPVKAKTNGTPVSLRKTKPAVKITKSLSSSKPSIRKGSATTSNPSQSKSRSRLPKDSKVKAVQQS